MFTSSLKSAHATLKVFFLANVLYEALLERRRERPDAGDRSSEQIGGNRPGNTAKVAHPYPLVSHFSDHFLHNLAQLSNLEH